MDKTESEIALEEFCDANGIHWERIPTEDAAGLKTPDYYIYSFGEQVAAEVKEIQPSPDEREQERHLKEKGWSTFGATPGARARAIIGTAGKQLRAKAKGTCPAMVVLYNPSFLLRHHTEPYAIRVAMYGLDAVVLGLPADMQQSPYLIDRKSGPKRKMTEEHNRLRCYLRTSHKPSSSSRKKAAVSAWLLFLAMRRFSFGERGRLTVSMLALPVCSWLNLSLAQSTSTLLTAGLCRIA